MPPEANVINPLLPILAVGFAVQRLMEILDPVVDLVLTKLGRPESKKIFLGLASLITGLVLAFTAKLQFLLYLGVNLTQFPAFLDYLVTGLILSGGTEGVNSVLKFLSYKKEGRKEETKAVKERSLIPPALSGFAQPVNLLLRPQAEPVRARVLSHAESLEVVICCIKAMTGLANIKPDDKLKDLEIDNDQMLRELKNRTLICARSKTGTTIDFEAFMDQQTYTSNDTVDRAATCVEFGVIAGS